jgi:hypothetical protein
VSNWTDITTLKEEYLDVSAQTNDSFLQRLLNSAEGEIERYCRRQFHPEPADPNGADVTKQVLVRAGSRDVRIPDCREASLVMYAGVEVLPITGASLFPAGYVLDTSREPATVLELMAPFYWPAYLQITGKFGWDPIPDELEDVTYALAARFYRERDAGYSDAVQTAQGFLSYFRQLPPRLQMVLDSLRVPNWALIGGAPTL